ncbi:MAG: tyrosine-type recombinase/integrase, partial [Thermodesulfobacteriota bacterium]
MINLVKANTTALNRAMKTVSYLSPEEVTALIEAVSGNKKAERDALMILVLFQTGLRISEVLSLSPA